MSARAATASAPLRPAAGGDRRHASATARRAAGGGPGTASRPPRATPPAARFAREAVPLHRGDPAGERVRQGDRRPLRRAGERVVGARPGRARCRLYVDATSAASNAIAPSEPVPSAATNRWWRCSIADCGWSVTSASRRSSRPTRSATFAETSATVSPTPISPAPHLRRDLLRREAALPVRVGQREEPRLADEVRVDRPDRQRRTARSPRTTATPIPTGPASSVTGPRPSRSRCARSRLFAERTAFARTTWIPADSS